MARSSQRTLARTAVACLAAVASTGCAVNEEKEISLYRDVLDGAEPVRVTYTAGEPLTLPAALLLTNQHNERLAIGGEDYVQALIEKQRAAANFFPTISLIPSYSRADADGDADGRRRIGDTASEDELRSRSGLSTGDGRLDVPVNLNVNLFRGFRDLAAVRRAGFDIERARAALLDLQATVLLDVARAYYQVLGLERAVRVLEASAETQNARVREMRTRDVVGTAQKLDVAQIEAQAASTRADLIAARNDLRNARVLLAFLVAAPVADAPLVDRLDIPPAITPVDVFLAVAEAERKDLAAARANVEAARQNVEVAFGEYYPSVSLNVNAYLSRDSEPDDSQWNALLSVNLPLFTGGRINANHRTALSQLRQAALQASLARRQVEQEVLTAYENLVASTNRLEELRIETAAAQTALDVAEGRYRAGLGTYLERLVAQDAQLTAQLEYAQEEYARKIAYVDLLRVTGQLTRPADPLVLPLPPVGALPAPTLVPGTNPAPTRATHLTTRPAPVPAPSTAIGLAPPTQPAALAPTTQPATTQPTTP